MDEYMVVRYLQCDPFTHGVSFEYFSLHVPWAVNGKHSLSLYKVYILQ